MKVLLLVSVLFISSIGYATSDVPVEQKVIELHIYKNKKEVEAKRKKSKGNKPLNHGTCSGAFISPYGHILTAKHCVDDGDYFEAITYDNKRYRVDVVAMSKKHDLALIHIDKFKTPYFQLSTSTVRGQRIFILGSPLSITDVLVTGILAKVDGDLFYLDCSALPGNSGSAVYDEQGKLIGVLTAVHVAGAGFTHLSVAQGLDAITFFLLSVFGR
jgi:S1-C subfamily serine protease